MKKLLVILKNFVSTEHGKQMIAAVNVFLTRYKYVSDRRIVYTCPHTRKLIIVPVGFPSDGATFAWDIKSDSWWVHDKACADGTWADGTPVTAFEAARILYTILRREHRPYRAVYWSVGTFLFGCKKARTNGWW